MRRRDYAAAVAEHRKALAIDATNSMAHFFSANVLMRLDRPNEARASVVAALSYKPVYETLDKVLDTQPSKSSASAARSPRRCIPRSYTRR